MNELISKMINLELGVLSMTTDKIRNIVDELIRAGEVSQDEGKKLVDEYIRRGEKSRLDLKTEIGKMIAENIDTAGLVTRKEFEEVRLELQQLRKALRKEVIEETFEKKEV